MTELLQENSPVMIEWMQDISPQLWLIARQEVIASVSMNMIAAITLCVAVIVAISKVLDKYNECDNYWIILLVLWLCACAAIGFVVFISGIYKFLTLDYQTILTLKNMFL